MSLKSKVVLKELNGWLEKNLIDNELFTRLSALYPQESWDFRLIIKWALVIGAVLLGIGIILLVSLLFNSIGFIVLVLTALSAGLYVPGFLLGGKNARRSLPRTGNALVAVACLVFGADIFTIAKWLQDMSVISGDHWSILLLVISIIYFLIAYLNRNPVVLVLAFLGLATWFGSESAYASGWGSYFFGMNYPLRFALVSPLVILAGYAQKKFIPDMNRGFVKIHYVMGLLYTNMALWILSIFGARNEWDWTQNHAELFLFSLLWGAFSVATFILGSRFRNRAFTGFAVVFLLINLYTRFFEYFWNDWDKSVFFIVLGALSLGIGIFFERWTRRKKTVEGEKKKEPRNAPISGQTDGF
jgi:uncharacterized membrane protein